MLYLMRPNEECLFGRFLDIRMPGFAWHPLRRGVRQIYEGRKEALKGKGQRLKQAELRQLYEK